jgi:hypothetical protein
MSTGRKTPFEWTNIAPISGTQRLLDASETADFTTLARRCSRRG